MPQNIKLSWNTVTDATFAMQKLLIYQEAIRSQNVILPHQTEIHSELKEKNTMDKNNTFFSLFCELSH